MFAFTPLRANLTRSSINISLALALGALLTACGGGGNGDGDNDYKYHTVFNTPSTAPTVEAPDGARLLAAQCFQCHGTAGLSATGIDTIAGMSAAKLIGEMLEMKYSVKADIMHYQAKGYNEEQIRAIATYLAALPRNGWRN
ncbi:MAG: c-type cytochrome [Thiothrix sp.]